MKKITVTILSFFFIAQLFAQDGYLLDSLVSSAFVPPLQGVVTGTKFHYDELNRVVLENSEYDSIRFEYGKDSEIRTKFSKSSNYVHKSEKKVNPKGGLLYEAVYYKPNASVDYILSNEYYATRDIYNNLLEGQSFYHEDGVKRKNFFSYRSYNKYRLLEKYENIGYDEETQEVKYLYSIQYEYDQDKNLISELTTQADPENGEAYYYDSIAYSYDNFERLALAQHYSILGDKGTTIEYQYYDNYSIERLTRTNGNINENVRYDATNTFAPFDSLAEYEFILSERILTNYQTYADVSGENPTYDYALLRRQAYLNDDGTLNSLRQYKSLYRKTPEPEILIVDEINFEILSNPVLAHNYFNVFSELGSYDQIQIFDMSGALVATQPSNGLSLNTFRSPGPSGTYLIRLINDGKVVSATRQMIVL
ncbi:T9SS type A sorting domain-containing protein [Saprospiraceae bacterium]|nr:T9SS type A sorting domain-containing protein [Saprospiraceae bacterium]